MPRSFVVVSRNSLLLMTVQSVTLPFSFFTASSHVMLKRRSTSVSVDGAFTMAMSFSVIPRELMMSLFFTGTSFLFVSLL